MIATPAMTPMTIPAVAPELKVELLDELLEPEGALPPRLGTALAIGLPVGAIVDLDGADEGVREGSIGIIVGLVGSIEIRLRKGLKLGVTVGSVGR